MSRVSCQLDETAVTNNCGGSSEIRTHDQVSPAPVFKTGVFNRSTILPNVINGAPSRTRTGTPLQAWDFKSRMSTAFITGALLITLDLISQHYIEKQY